MIFFGHRFLQNENFYHIFDIDSIQKTPPSSTVYVEFNEENIDIINHALKNGVKTAVSAQNITDILYASSLGASFIIVKKDLAKTAQNIAENYLFDAKILILIKEEKEIEELGLLGVDGVIFPDAIIKINS